MSQLDKALALAELGINVFPCREVDSEKNGRVYTAKGPYTRNGFQDATTEKKQIGKWWTRWPEALVGYWAGGSDLVVLDIDVDEKKELDGWVSLKLADIEPDPTFHYTTARGGAHYIYRYSGNEKLGPDKDYLSLEGIDRRAGGSYAIWWPETVVSSLDKFAPAPEWLCHPTSSSATYEFSGSSEQWLATIEAGDPDEAMLHAIGSIPVEDFGHDTLIRLQYLIIRLGAEGHPGAKKALGKLRKEWLRKPWNEPAYEQEFMAGFEGAVRKGGRLAISDKEFWGTRPELQHIFNVAKATTTSPWALFGAVLQRTLHVTDFGVRYKSYVGEMPLNTLVAYIGPSGLGKSVLQKRAELAFDFGDDSSFAVLSAGSGESIPDAYAERSEKETKITAGDVQAMQEGSSFFNDMGVDVDEIDTDGLKWLNPQHAALWSFDEVGALEATSSRTGATIVEYMKQGYSGETLGRVLAGRRGVLLPRSSYRFGMFVNTQPARAGMFFSQNALSGGLPGRFLWFNIQDPEVIDKLSTQTFERRDMKPMEWKDKLIHALPSMSQAHFKEIKRRHQTAFDDTRGDMDSHELLTRAKVACALAIMNRRTHLIEEDWELSEKVIDHSVTTRNKVLRVLDSRALRDIERAGVAEARRTAVMENTLHADRVQKTKERLVELRDEKKIPEKRWASSLSKQQRDVYEEAKAMMEAEK